MKLIVKWVDWFCLALQSCEWWLSNLLNTSWADWSYLDLQSGGRQPVLFEWHTNQVLRATELKSSFRFRTLMWRRVYETKETRDGNQTPRSWRRETTNTCNNGERSGKWSKRCETSNDLCQNWFLACQRPSLAVTNSAEVVTARVKMNLMCFWCLRRVKSLSYGHY